MRELQITLIFIIVVLTPVTLQVALKNDSNRPYKERLNLKVDGTKWLIYNYECWVRSCLSVCNNDEEDCYQTCRCKNPNFLRHTIYMGPPSYFHKL